MTDKIIQLLPFDGKEGLNPDLSRQNYGNNRYSQSNIRQWLNSTATSGWYSAQHTYDAPPSSSNVSVNAYDTRAGFLAIFDATFVNAMLNTTLTVVKNTVTDGGGYETVTDKMFLASTTEVGLANENSIAEGTKLALFTDDASRVAYCTQEAIDTSTYTYNPMTSQAWPWWLRTPFSSEAFYVRDVRPTGSLAGNDAFNGTMGIRPLCNVSSSSLVSDTTNTNDCYTLILWNIPPSTPSFIDVPTSVYGNNTAVISWGASTDPENSLGGYILQRSVDGGTFVQIYKGASLSYTDTITLGWTTVTYRVCAYDTSDTQSDWQTSATRTVNNNQPPVISGTDENLGEKTDGFTITYTVTDAENDTVTVTEKIDNVTLRTYIVTLGATNTLAVTDMTWLSLLNGSHTITITASDVNGNSASRIYIFNKNINSFTIQNSTPLSASVRPTRIKMVVTRNIPAGATFKVYVCNNGFDETPTWEDATSSVTGGLVHVFANTIKTAGNWGVLIKVEVNRGSAEGACFVSQIGGNFE
ncbi:MAG: fibronectin type III domain-containing protein [Veillonellaceae bacterium]|nr:fibronectin type III domain-containing protein [Veillonellaceae bacterium]